MNKNIDIYYGLSTDNKPTNVKNGSIFYELNTPAIYVFYNGTWYKQTEKQGGIDTSDATATANDILLGKTAYARGEKLTGTYQEDTYIELTYIQSTGTQYIDTELNVSNGFYINIDFEVTSYGTEQFNPIFGTQNASSPLQSCELRVFKPYQRWETMLGSSANNSVLLDTRYNVEYTQSLTHITFVANNQTIQDADRSSDITQNNFHLMNCNNGTTRASFIKLYSAKIYDLSNNLLRDYIPVKRKSDGEICLYDKITKTFFTNQGTGSFIGILSE